MSKMLHETLKFVHKIRNILHEADGTFGLAYILDSYNVKLSTGTLPNLRWNSFR